MFSNDTSEITGLQELKGEVQHCLSEDKLNKAIKMLCEGKSLFSFFDRIQILYFRLRYQRIRLVHSIGAISNEKFKTQKNKLAHAILRFFKEKKRLPLIYLKASFLSFLTVTLCFLGYRYMDGNQLVPLLGTENFIDCPEGTKVWIVTNKKNFETTVQSDKRFNIILPKKIIDEITEIQIYYGKESEDCSFPIKKNQSRTIGKVERCGC